MCAAKALELNLREEFVQADRVFAELAAVVAGVDGQHAFAGGRFDGGPHGGGDGRLVDAVDDDFVGAVGARDEFRLDAVAERGAVGFGGRGDERFVFRADFAAAAADAAGEGGDDAGERGNGSGGPLGRG